MVKRKKIETRTGLLLLVIGLLLLSAPGFGQEETNYNQQLWLDYNPKVVMGNSPFLLYGNLGYRTIFPSDWHRYYLNIGISYSPFIHNENLASAIQYLQLHGGIADFYTQSLEDLNMNEIRTYVGVKFRWPSLKRVYFTHYTRFEQRFESLSDSDVRENTPRFRYRLSAKIRLLKPALHDFYIPAHAEIFTNTGRELYFKEVTRITFGLGYDINDHFSTAVLLSYHFSRNSSSDPFENNDLVYRLRLYHTF